MEAVRVAVVGGGLAGVSAALELVRRGLFVELFERSPALGGRAGSFPGPTGELLDVGQHVYLGCCTAYRSFLEALGTADRAPLQRRLAVSLYDGTKAAALCAWPLPFPLSLAGAVLSYGHLRFSERLQALATVRAAARQYAREQGLSEPPSARIPFSEWLERRRESKRSMRALWEPLILAALNQKPCAVSARYGLMVLALGLAGGADSAAIGIPKVPLSSLLEPAHGLIAGRGAVHLRTAVHSLLLRDGRAAGVRLSDGRTLEADAVVWATGHTDAARRLARQGMPPDADLGSLGRVGASPIVNVHLWYDRRVFPPPMACVVGSPLQWIFDVSALQGRAGNAVHYAVSLSGAEAFMAMSRTRLVELMDAEVRRIFPRAPKARLLGHAVRKIQSATFLVGPGDERLRPGNETSVPGLFLAGDYTRTGWPATMESAVRSGRMCAEAVLKKLPRSSPAR